MNLWHISDTHMLHEQLPVPEGIDVVVHSGDATNSREWWINRPEMDRFILWYAQLPIKHKIFVPGNHDTSLFEGPQNRAVFKEQGIHLLNEDETEIEGVRFFGSPWVPRYGDWAFMTDRSKLARKWEIIPDDTDVLITHGPPFGVLDATYAHSGQVELAGCRALQKRVFAIQPRLHLFGHVHSHKDIRNTGVRTLSHIPTQFSNGSCCDDGNYVSITSRGNILVVP